MASAGPPSSDYVFDVQVKTPGGNWMNWQTGVTIRKANYTPLTPGTYAFRARLRNVTLGKSSGYSPIGKIVVS